MPPYVMYCKIELKACLNILPMKNILADILKEKPVSFLLVDGSDLIVKIYSILATNPFENLSSANPPVYRWF